MRVAWNSHSYTKAGKHFGQALFKFYDGLVPEDESARMPMVTVHNMMPLSKIFQTFPDLFLPVASSKKQRAKPSSPILRFPMRSPSCITSRPNSPNSWWTSPNSRRTFYKKTTQPQISFSDRCSPSSASQSPPTTWNTSNELRTKDTIKTLTKLI